MSDGQTNERKHPIQWQKWVDSERKHQNMVMFYFATPAHPIASDWERHVKRRSN